MKSLQVLVFIQTYYTAYIHYWLPTSYCADDATEITWEYISLPFVMILSPFVMTLWCNQSSLHGFTCSGQRQLDVSFDVNSCEWKLLFIMHFLLSKPVTIHNGKKVHALHMKCDILCTHVEWCWRGCNFRQHYIGSSYLSPTHLPEMPCFKPFLNLLAVWNVDGSCLKTTGIK